MKALICPVSPLRIDRNVARMTAFAMASLIALYLFTGTIATVVVVVIDYFIRAFTRLKYSPMSWAASQLGHHFNLPAQPIDKAPKIFAARVGFLFALATVLLYPILPMVSLVVGFTLMAFALLESVFDFCVGCIVYTYIVFPIFRSTSRP